MYEVFGQNGLFSGGCKLTYVSDGNIDCHQQQVNDNILVVNSSRRIFEKDIGYPVRLVQVAPTHMMRVTGLIVTCVETLSGLAEMEESTMQGLPGDRITSSKSIRCETAICFPCDHNDLLA
ncbi:hypothetical protein Taro_048307 [Colocasia esculenta]|uniref:Uncharacterized protein n=1 Tax=Colocasia esculenta TaxID=4460 RepID=A0A843X6D0_COLES|nr:hypothetical protein [Colocasia esculenta]